MAKVKVDAKLLSIDEIYPLDLSKNVRDPSGSTMDLEGLKADILMTGGLKIRPLVHFVGGKFDKVLQGYRRISSVGELHREHPEDRRWDSVEVEIVNDLTQSEQISLMVDHGNTKSLEKHEVVLAIFRTLDANPMIGRENLVTHVHGLLEIHWPTPKNKTEPKEIAQHYTGTIQNIMAGWRLPDTARDYYYEMVKGGKAVSYRKKDLQTLVQVFEQEMKSDPTLNKSNPGPVFKKKWEEFVQSEDDRDNEGKKPKGIAAMSKTELTAIHDSTQSALLKCVIKCVIRETADSDKKVLTLGAWFVREVESKFDEATKSQFLAIMNGEFQKAGF